MTTSPEPPGSQRSSAGLLGSVRRHPWRVLSVSLLVLVAGAAVMSRDVIGLWLTPDDGIDMTLPTAESLQPGTDETVYTIDATGSKLTVGVDEQLAGSAKRVELVTRGIAGDVGVTDGDDPRVRLGEIVVDVQQLESDNALRDKLLRHQYLESSFHQLVFLRDVTVTLPDDATATAVDDATLAGTLVVKDEPFPVTWNVDAQLADGVLTATANAELTMSELGIGPITKVGLVSTSNEIDLTLELTARDAASYEPPTSHTLEQVVADEDPDGPSFAADIAPILEQNCASCHERGAIGASMWALDDAGDAAEVADGIALVTTTEYMPPWPASEKGVPLRDTRGLTPEEISTLKDWADAGAPLDVEAGTRIEAPAEAQITPPRPDRVLRMEEPYKLSGDKLDDYRCFILDPKITEPTFVTAYTFDPDQLGTVHHAIVTKVSADGVDAVRAKDAADDGPGYSCVAGMGSGDGVGFGGWVPGQRPARYEEGYGKAMEPGDVLVAQIHYHYDAAAPADRSGMTLQLADDPTGLINIGGRTLIGPVELPCPPGSTQELCDRDAALADVAERFGPGAPRIANGLHLVCGSTVEEIAAKSDGIRAETTCDYTLRRAADIVSMTPHMHELGSSYDMTLNPDSDDEVTLIDIPVWNFGWQLAYAPVDPVRVEAGDTVRVTCRWDRGLRYDPTPSYIVFAEGTEDEMCFSTIGLRPLAEDATGVNDAG